ncbi:polysaccharide biosynthesis protein [Desulfurispirillum indicum S5]|uniref:Polysaccharide biosynthesis protein n=1 Tax=Desulfurispirillum indicum (strain ATCC BAA-1389 / DSM 22839 / S5) TaxID=653733 RepID=E6W5B1_DESIS|nr:flippase [Desulfurispirillum indicum]ADU67190.1 polysaccharide biosynthesis protein [Desulfurispirillum indicum S5]
MASSPLINQPWLKYLPLCIRRRVEGQVYLQNVVGNTAWQFGDQILRMGVGLLVGIWLARYLGPEQFGLFSYALAFTALFTAIAGLGMDDIVVRDVVRAPEKRYEILGTAFGLRMVSGAISFMVAMVVIVLLRPEDTLSHWLVGIVAAGSLFHGFFIIEFWFHSQVQAKYMVMAKGSAFFLCALVKVGMILMELPLIAFAWVTLLEVILGAFGLIAVYLSKAERLSLWRWRYQAAAKMLRDSWPLMLSAVVIMIYLRIDQILLGELAGNEAVGIYSVAVRLSEVWYFIPAAIYWSVYPAIVEAKGISEELFYERLQKLYRLMVFSSYALALPVVFVAQWLVPFLFGEAYGQAGVMLGVLIWSNVFVSLEMARSSFLTVMNWTRMYLVTVVLGCLLNIALNLWLIPIYGGIGAAVASLVAYWFAAHGSCFLFRQLRPTGRMLSSALVNPRFW